MLYHKESNSYIKEGQAFTVNGIQFLQGWKSFTQEELDQFGLSVVIVEGVRESQLTHYVTEEYVDGKLIITNTPKPEETLVQQDLPRLEEVIARFKTLRKVVLDSLTGIAGRAVWKGNTDLTNVCYSTQESIITLNDGLPSDAAAAIVELRARYEKLKTDVIATAPELASVFPDLYI